MRLRWWLPKVILGEEVYSSSPYLRRHRVKVVDSIADHIEEDA